jgi:hypothetical protein
MEILHDGESVMEPRQTETVKVRELVIGDTVVRKNLHGVPFYRVISSIEESGGHWTVSYDQDRDTAGPGELGKGTISNGGETLAPDTEVTRVSDLGDYEMTQVYSLRPLDKTACGRGVWQVAKQVDSQRRTLVRFAGTDNFEPYPLCSTVLVEGRRVNVHVAGGQKKSEKERYGL